MVILIILFGLATASAGLIILYDPRLIFDVLRRSIENVLLYIVAIVLRLSIGLLLLEYADLSRYPYVIEILGWLSIAAAMTFAVMGHSRFLVLMRWAFGMIDRFGRVAGAFAFLFGGFLAYAFI